MNYACATLRTESGETTILEGVTAQGRVEGLLFDLTVEQRYRNTSPRNVEAIYTFPLPWGAVLLSLEFEIGGRKLAGTVVKKERAERRYEEALDAGDTAVLLERTADGLYTVNVGNLMAGEAAVIRYRYAQLLRFEKGSARLTIPTVIAPRYGNALTQAGLEIQQVPDSDFLAEYPFEATIEVREPLASGRIHSPSHAISTRRTQGATIISLVRKGFLDRDFVLAVDELEGRAIPSVARDGTGAVAIASFCPSIPQSGKREARAVKILVDCSGSMAGDSIEAAKRALHEILASLEPRDRFSLARFGSQYEADTSGLVSAAPKAIAAAARAVFALQADMGGTEMEAAMHATLGQSPGMRADVLLITDGQVWNAEGVIQSAVSSGHRVFAVGIGAAPAESMLRRLAEETGGACEFVLPGEDAEGAITRMFLRLSEKPAGTVSISWPAKPLWQLPLPKALFDGETVHVVAGFAEPPVGAAELSVAPEDGQAAIRSRVVISECSPVDALARIAASMRISSMDAAGAVDLAVRYQLVTDATSCVLVHVRAEGEKAVDLPETVKVKQMLAAGWGGTSLATSEPRGGQFNLAYPSPCMAEPSSSHSMKEDCLSCLSRTESAKVHSPREFIDSILSKSRLSPIGVLSLPRTLAELEGAGIDSEVLSILRGFAGEGHSEADIVNAFLEALIPIAVAMGAPRLAVRKLRHLLDRRANAGELRSKVNAALASLTAERWH